MIGTNINPLLKSHLQTNGFGSVEIYPINAYANSSAPFITWVEFPSTKSSEIYWMHQSTLTYSIFDNDLSRAKDIAILIQKYLNVGDDISSLKTLMTSPTPIYRLCWSRFVNGGMFPPLEREGYASMTRSFEVGYVEV
jgi:hypothetical protein